VFKIIKQRLYVGVAKQQLSHFFPLFFRSESSKLQHFPLAPIRKVKLSSISQKQLDNVNLCEFIAQLYFQAALVVLADPTL
jgi:hypothetical protein